MCDPNLLAMTSLGLDVSSTTMGAVSGFQTAQARKAGAKANAKLAGERAVDARKRGELELEKHRREVANLKGSQRASIGASGIALDSDTPVSILTSTDVLGEADARMIQQNAARESYGFKVEEAQYKADAKGENPFLSGLAPLIAGGSSVASKWYQFKTSGAIGAKPNKKFKYEGQLPGYGASTG